MIRVVLPQHLRILANCEREIRLEVSAPVTVQSILNVLEEQYPVLRGTIREHVSGKRRALVRFFACEEDLSHEPMDSPLPAKVASGQEPLFIIAAIAGG